mmetsp:Transcript_10878/g.33359  ORF Transcript_10878/g.33359 Transcript_10878/m.33359 type:complete len:206 (-) Transcript_10878:1051-1668(-)
MDGLARLCHGVLRGRLARFSRTSGEWVPATVIGVDDGRVVPIEVDSDPLRDAMQDGEMPPLDDELRMARLRSGGVFDLRVDGGWRERVHLLKVRYSDLSAAPINCILRAAPPHMDIATRCAVAILGLDECPAIVRDKATPWIRSPAFWVRSPAFTRPPRLLFADARNKGIDEVIFSEELLSPEENSTLVPSNLRKVVLQFRSTSL